MMMMRLMMKKMKKMKPGKIITKKIVSLLKTQMWLKKEEKIIATEQ